MKYNITPETYQRMTQKSKNYRTPTLLRYHAFRDKVHEEGVDFNNGDSIIFTVPMAKSWPDKKKREHVGKPHLQKPDIDNYTKALIDAVYRHKEKDDCHVWHLGEIKKIWGYEGSIEIKEQYND